MDFSGNNRNCPCSLRILSEATKILCPTRWEAKWRLGTTPLQSGCCGKLGLPTLPLGLESLRSRRRASWEQCLAWCLASKEAEFAGCFQPRAGLPASSFTPILARHLAWLQPRGVVCDSCPHNFLLFRARLWSHLPGSSFCWSLLLFQIHGLLPAQHPRQMIHFNPGWSLHCDLLA